MSRYGADVDRNIRLLNMANERRRRLEKQLPIYVYGWPTEKVDWANYGRPHAKQAAFHGSDAMIRLISGGNRSGKTHSGCSEDVAHALGHRPWLPKDHDDYIVKGGDGKPIRVPNKGIIGGESFKEQIAKVTIKKLLGNPEAGEAGLIPPELVKKTRKDQSGVIVYIQLTNGSEIFFKSYEQEVRLWEGDDNDWVHFDEPPTRDHYIAAKRGLTDRQGRCWFTLTPLSQAWIKDDIVDHHNDPERSVFAVEVDIQDNVGYGLTQDGVDEFARTLNEDEKEMRLHGRFFHLVGMIYKEFNRGVHLKPRPDRLPSQWGYYMHIDYHPRKPIAAVWVAVRPDNTKFVIGELYNPDRRSRISKMCEAMREYEREYLGINGYEIERLIDPLAKTPNGRGGDAMGDFAEEGFECIVGSKERRSCINLMHEHLAYDEARGEYPMLYVYDDLIGFRKEIENYQWEPQISKSRKQTGIKEEPLKVNDDLLEGVHRILRVDPQAPGYDEYDEDEDQYDAISVGYSDGYSG